MPRSVGSGSRWCLAGRRNPSVSWWPGPRNSTASGVVLVAPGISEEAGGALVAAAVAGAICGEGDPALPLGGVELRGIPGLALRYGESELDTLLQGGVTPVELAGGVCSVVRGVTTRTTTGGVSDSTWRELTTILVVDDVIPGVRNALRAKFPRAKNTAQTRGRYAPR